MLDTCPCYLPGTCMNSSLAQRGQRTEEGLARKRLQVFHPPICFLFLCKFLLIDVAKMKEEEHESINKFEMALIDEVEKQDELHIKMRQLWQEDRGPASEFRHHKLNELMDMQIEVQFILSGFNQM